MCRSAHMGNRVPSGRPPPGICTPDKNYEKFMNWTLQLKQILSLPFSDLITCAVSPVPCHTQHLCQMWRGQMLLAHPSPPLPPPPLLHLSRLVFSALHSADPPWFSPTGSPSSPNFNFWDWDYDRPTPPHWAEVLFCKILLRPDKLWWTFLHCAFSKFSSRQILLLSANRLICSPPFTFMRKLRRRQ